MSRTKEIPIRLLPAGPVKLLTDPVAAGYAQNPISVYYCYSNDRKLQRCIAEVSGTCCEYHTNPLT